VHGAEEEEEGGAFDLGGNNNGGFDDHPYCDGGENNPRLGNGYGDDSGCANKPRPPSRPPCKPPLARRAASGGNGNYGRRPPSHRRVISRGSDSNSSHTGSQTGSQTGSRTGSDGSAGVAPTRPAMGGGNRFDLDNGAGQAVQSAGRALCRPGSAAPLRPSSAASDYPAPAQYRRHSGPPAAFERIAKLQPPRRRIKRAGRGGQRRGRGHAGWDPTQLPVAATFEAQRKSKAAARRRNRAGAKQPRPRRYGEALASSNW
jgi:hypothetical protein